MNKEDAELVKQLNHEASCFENDCGSDPEADYGTARLIRKAVSTIKRLISERDEAREALRPFEELSDIVDATGASKIGGPDLGRLLRSARAARSPKETP